MIWRGDTELSHCRRLAAGCSIRPAAGGCRPSVADVPHSRADSGSALRECLATSSVPRRCPRQSAEIGWGHPDTLRVEHAISLDRDDDEADAQIDSRQGRAGRELESHSTAQDEHVTLDLARWADDQGAGHSVRTGSEPVLVATRGRKVRVFGLADGPPDHPGEPGLNFFNGRRLRPRPQKCHMLVLAIADRDRESVSDPPNGDEYSPVAHPERPEARRQSGARVPRDRPTPSGAHDGPLSYRGSATAPSFWIGLANGLRTSAGATRERCRVASGCGPPAPRRHLEQSIAAR